MTWRDWFALILMLVLTIKPEWAPFRFVPRKPADTEGEQGG